MPARLRKLAKALRKHGVRLEKPRSGGSHWRAVLGSKMYPIPAHNGLKTEIPDIYISGVCRNLGLDEDSVRSAL